MKKRLFTICLVLLMITTHFVPVAQAVSISTEIFTSERILDNSITVETTIVVHGSDKLFRTTSSKSATKTDVYKYNGTKIATISLTASFGYDGTSSWVNNSSVSKTIASGWKYSGENITNARGTATVTATLKKPLITTVNVNTSMTCSPTGAIS